jgi:four helix bundle protein
MSYRTLEIWQLARAVSVDIHNMTLQKLPGFEMREEGAQIRRSSKSVRSNIVEGYGRRRYKQDFIRFLTYAHASCDETTDHLETLFETGSLSDQEAFKDLQGRLAVLGGKLCRFIEAVEAHHLSAREEAADYETGESTSRISHPASCIVHPDTPASRILHPASCISHPASCPPPPPPSPPSPPRT